MKDSFELEIVYYINENGCSPVGEWVDSLIKKSDQKHYAVQLKQFNMTIAYLCRLGTRAPKDKVRHLYEDIWELRPGDNRVLLFMWQDNKVVLLHKFGPKQTAKTPPNEIRKAVNERNDWIARNEK